MRNFRERSFFASALAVGLLLSAPTHANAPGEGSSVRVECTRSSAFIQVQVNSDRKIGKVVLEVRDADGRTLYREEGKAMTGELVRRLDKGAFPRGTHTITVRARDLDITQQFSID
ncbi:MAG: hypothetical protein ACK6A5_16970 [Flavobacteriales bacterium]|jgi:hypothetical protein